MTICFFGNYDKAYTRNRVLLRGLVLAGSVVKECHTEQTGLAGLRELIKKHRELGSSYDLLLVGYSDNRYLVPLAKIISRKPIVWDAFFSRYDTYVCDRKLISRFGIKAVYHYVSDVFSLLLADTILLDTHTHIQRFVRLFRISSAKYIRVFVGADINPLSGK